MECLICGNKELKTIDTKMSDFLVARIFGEAEVLKGVPVHLCHCPKCSFSFYDRRLTEEEEKKLYADYRGNEYQKLREKYDCWYTAKANEALNHDIKSLNEQRRVISEIIERNIKNPLLSVLDYGGNKGETFGDKFVDAKKYVYDISGVETVDGVQRISRYEELFNYDFDFIMCNMTLEHIGDPISFTKKLYDIGAKKTFYYFEVPSENPFIKNKFSIKNNIKTFFNPNYNKAKLIKHYLHIRKGPYMPMNEHVNFFTPKALKTLLENVGFDVIDIEENIEKSALEEALVLSALCVK